MHQHRAEQRKYKCCSMAGKTVALVAARCPTRRTRGPPMKAPASTRRVRERLARREDARKGRLVVLARRQARKEIPNEGHRGATSHRNARDQASAAREASASARAARRESDDEPSTRDTPAASPPPQCRRRPARSVRRRPVDRPRARARSPRGARRARRRRPPPPSPSPGRRP